MDERERQWSFDTRAVHSGERHLPADRPVTTPIYASVGFVGEDMAKMDAVFGGEESGYVYTRYGNPTVAALERAVADLEGGEEAVAFASGMAAVHAALVAANLRPG